MEDKNLHVAAAGLGVNTIAMLILATRKGIKFDLIQFADPGKEHKGTYEYIPVINKWLVDHNQPEVSIVYKRDKYKNRLTLYDDSIIRHDLPSIAFGYKKCSQKFKRNPQEVFLNNWEPAIYCWANGGKVIKYIGYDADESHRTLKDHSDKKYSFRHLLVEEDMGRFECAKLILDEGLPLPPKSSCTFCPSMKPWEIIELYENEPREFYDAITMERNAAENLLTIKGLGRDFSWWDLIVAYRYLKFVQRANKVGLYIPLKIQKLMDKVNNSRPVDYEKLAQNRNNPTQQVCDLFKQNIDMPCECMS